MKDFHNNAIEGLPEDAVTLPDTVGNLNRDFRPNAPAWNEQQWLEYFRLSSSPFRFPEQSRSDRELAEYEALRASSTASRLGLLPSSPIYDNFKPDDFTGGGF